LIERPASYTVEDGRVMRCQENRLGGRDTAPGVSQDCRTMDRRATFSGRAAAS